MALPEGAHYVRGTFGRRVRLASGEVVTKHRADTITAQQRYGTGVRGLRRERSEAKANLARQAPRVSQADVNKAVDKLTPAELRTVRFGTSAQIADLQRNRLARDPEGRFTRVRRGKRFNPFWYH